MIDLQLKNYPGDVEADLALNFTVTDDEFGERKTTELVPGGSNIPVTRENRLQYIYRVSHYRLSAQISRQCDAFFAGLSDLIDPRWLRMLNREELRVLVSGTGDPIDLEDLRANTVYGGFHEKDLTVEYFWNTLETFDQPTRKAFLKFVTSCPSPPLLGFSQLNPKCKSAGGSVLCACAFTHGLPHRCSAMSRQLPFVMPATMKRDCRRRRLVW